MIPAPSLIKPPAVEMIPVIIDPAATAPVPVIVTSEATDLMVPNVSVPPPELLEIVRASLNRMSAEIVSPLGEPFSLLMDTAPSVSSKINKPFVPAASVYPGAPSVGSVAPKFSSPMVITALRFTVCAPASAPLRLATSPIALGKPVPPQLAESVQL